MLRSIMVEMGDNRQSAAAMETGLWLAKSFGAQLQALTCLDERSVQRDDVRRMLEEHVRVRQAQFEQQCRAEGITCVSDLEVGDPTSAIVHLSRKADLLVIGSAPDPDAQARGYSSGASSLAREVVRHVLVTRDQAPAFKSIVVGYAGQENSCNALQLAAHIAEKSGGTIHVVTSGHDVAQARAVLNVAVEYLKAYDVDVVPRQASEEAASALLDTVQEVDADLIAIGAIRRNKLSMFAFGDTAQRILDWSPAAVLVGR